MGTAAKDIAQHTSGLNPLEAFPQPSDESSEMTRSLGGTRPGHQHLSASVLAETLYFGTACLPSLQFSSARGQQSQLAERLDPRRCTVSSFRARTSPDQRIGTEFRSPC